MATSIWTNRFGDATIVPISELANQGKHIFRSSKRRKRLSRRWRRRRMAAGTHQPTAQ